MPSFDAVSEFDTQELNNAVNQATKEITNRFDLKNSDGKVEQNDSEVTLSAKESFQLEQIKEILKSKLIKRKIDVRAIEEKELVVNLGSSRQTLLIKQGIETDVAKKMIKYIKDKKLKVQAAIQGEKVRVTGKKRDDLQEVIALLKEEDFGIPLQFDNFRD